ncbi:MAG: DUF2975 domain-containing protein [Sediminibacterium sp.]
MKRVKVIAGGLFYFMRVLALIFGATAIYSIIVLGLSVLGGPTWLPINITDGQFTILYPVTSTPFLIGDYTAAYLVPTLLVVLFYTLFMFVLSSLFKALMQRKIFVRKSIVLLDRFYKINFVVPAAILLSSVLYGNESNDIKDYIMICFLHAVIGVFAFFMAAIFREGYVLQEEQDLTL